MQVSLKRRIQTDWAFATLDELKARRVEALNRAVQAEGDAVEPRRQTEMYLKSAGDLAARAVALQAFAKAHIAKGELAEAEAKQTMANECQQLSESNWRLADQKAQLAMKLEGQAHLENRIAQRLTMEIKSRTASFDPPDIPAA